MKIKLAILSNDEGYLKRLTSTFRIRFQDKVEVYSFTDQDVAVTSVKQSKIDLLLAESDLTIDSSIIPTRCVLAYLVDAPDVSSFRGQPAIFKFQKIDAIYTRIFDLCLEKYEGVITPVAAVEGDCKIVSFSSPSGGIGNTSMAIALSISLSNSGKRVFYLNLEYLCSTNAFFIDDAQSTMSDVIFLLKSNKPNIAIKLNSYAVQSEYGFFYFSPPKNALDMQELEVKDIIQLIALLSTSNSYDYIVLDYELGFDSNSVEILNKADQIVWLCDGTKLSNSKTEQAYEAFELLGHNSEFNLLQKVCLIYNKFSNKTGEKLNAINIVVSGGAPKYEGADIRQVVLKLASADIFGSII